MRKNSPIWKAWRSLSKRPRFSGKPNSFTRISRDQWFYEPMQTGFRGRCVWHVWHRRQFSLGSKAPWWRRAGSWRASAWWSCRQCRRDCRRSNTREQWRWPVLQETNIKIGFNKKSFLTKYTSLFFILYCIGHEDIGQVFYPTCITSCSCYKWIWKNTSYVKNGE